MKPKVSVIIPIYSVEPYLKQCVDSIRNQTLKDIEIILVDDGSPDRCPAMCDQFAEEDERIRVIHQKNQGVSAARNNGVKVAVGEWIAFCDPDDWMDERELDVLYSHAVQESADVVICDHYRVESGGAILERHMMADKISNYVLEGQAVMDLVYESVADGYLHSRNANFSVSMGIVYPWKRIYRAELVQDIEFPKGMHPNEDCVYNIRALSKAKKVVLASCCLHYYRVGTGVTGHFQENCVRNSLRAINVIQESLTGVCDPEILYECADKREAGILAFFLKFYCFHPDNPASYSARKRELKQYLSQNAEYGKRRKYYTFKQKITYCLIRLHIYWPFEAFRLHRKAMRHIKRIGGVGRCCQRSV